MAGLPLPRRLGPRALTALIVVTIALAIAFLVRSPPLEVELGEIRRGPITVTVEDEGETRVRDLYAIAAPVAGRLERIELEPGDPVIAGTTVVARLRPAGSALLDPRTRAVTRDQLRALASAADAAAQSVSEARAALTLARREHDRVAALVAKGFASRAALDRARAERDRAAAALAGAQANVATARASRDTARATLADPSSLAAPGMVIVTSPVSGRLMRDIEESERVVPAGTILAEVGDPATLEIVTDLLSSDAVRVKPGAAVELAEWGGDGVLHGRVRRIEPYGFLKLSALGVEEQRVNVVIDLTDPPERWARLGHGYRLLVRIAIWSAGDRLLVPVSALFRTGGRWAIFTVEAGRARETPVEVERMGSEVAALKTPLAPGTKVILHPSEKIVSKKRVVAR